MFWIILISRSRRSAYSARSCLSMPLARMGFQARTAFLEALAGDVFEVGVGGVVVGDIEAGKRLA